jgi:hypothetical protein
MCRISFAQQDSIVLPDLRSLISAGIGFSNVQFVYTQAHVLVEQPNVNRTAINANFRPHSSVVLNAEYDLRLHKRFSVGLAWSRQSYRFDYDSCYLNDRLMAGSFSDLMVLNNFGLKTLFYPIARPYGDLYLGSRLSYTIWSIRSETGQPYRAASLFRDGIRIQGIVGYRYFFSRHFGIYLEKNFGPPFFGQLGLNSRF